MKREFDDGDFTTTGEQVCAVLRDRVLRGEIGPGERLATARIAEEFGVSRMPVRDALKQLENEGLVEGRPMYGYRVNRPAIEALEGLMHLRQAVECQAAALCAARAGRAQIVELEELARRADEERCGGDGRAAQVELAFHETLARLAGYPEVTQTLHRVLTLIATFFTPQRCAKEDILHREIVQAIASGDPETARATMWDHIEFAIGEFGARTVADLRRENSGP